MSEKMLYSIDSEKSVEEVVQSIKEHAGNYDFMVRHVFNMGEEFKSHGVMVDEKFTYYSVMLCNPQKAYKSMTANLRRGAVLLPPKQVVVYAGNKGKTSIAYLAFNKEFVRKLLPDDEAFSEGLPASCRKIIQLINEVK